MSRFRTETHELRVTRKGVGLIEAAPRAGMPIDILVSDALTRYWIIERPAGLAGAGELDLYAGESFAMLFGDDPSDWSIRIDPVPGATRWLACAIPTLFTADLPRAVAEKGWEPRHIRPRFVRDYNQHCSRLGRDAVFCVASRESTTIGLIESGSWRSIRVHPPLGRDTASFGTLLRRDCRQAGMASDAIRPVVVGSLMDQAR